MFTFTARIASTKTVTSDQLIVIKSTILLNFINSIADSILFYCRFGKKKKKRILVISAYPMVRIYLYTKTHAQSVLNLAVRILLFMVTNTGDQVIFLVSMVKNSNKVSATNYCSIEYHQILNALIYQLLNDWFSKCEIFSIRNMYNIQINWKLLLQFTLFSAASAHNICIHCCCC